MQMEAFNKIPPASGKDRLMLLVNLIPLALSAAFRAFFWGLGLPMASWNWSLKEHFVWERDLIEGFDSSQTKDAKAQNMNRIVDAIMQRSAHQFPHTHGRPFPDHIAGVAKQLRYWQQPEHVCIAGFAHSVYATEMFPWSLYSLKERDTLRQLVGAKAEALIFLYCTASQNGLFHEVRRRAASLGRATTTDEEQPFFVRNYYTHEEERISMCQAAEVLVVLGADLVEQDHFFDCYLACSCLRVANPHLEVQLPLVSRLQEAGYFNISEKVHSDMDKRARSLITKAKRGGSKDLIGELLAASKIMPWHWELVLAALRLNMSGVETDIDNQTWWEHARNCRAWSEAWGTAWSTVCDAEEVLSWTRNTSA